MGEARLSFSGRRSADKGIVISNSGTRENESDIHALAPLSHGQTRGVPFVSLAPRAVKTTLLRILAGLKLPVRVRLSWEVSPGKDRVASFRKGHCSRGFHGKDNVAFPLRAGRRPHGVEAVTRAEAVLSDVGLTGSEGSFPTSSGGMRQRVALAREWCRNPDILLLDEPFSSLDTRMSHLLAEQMRELAVGLSATVVFVTYNIEEAALLGHRICVMGARPGRIVTKPYT
ncbi:MAG: ATP-binding cassette domain-containing protein [Ignavibacteriales bacterium]|nr:ATP-binding cassette domain-containing protein [Ignavibacteriales bacterium]